MFPSNGENSFENELYQNAPNMSLMYTMYSTTFGNMNFMVQPATPGEVQGGYPTIPYLSLEALIYQQQASNPQVAPANVIGGGTSGTQTIRGSQQVVDATGTTRMVIGYQQNGF